jgi:hypothetical protein
MALAATQQTPTLSRMDSEAPAGPVAIILAAITQQRCVTATWNRDRVVLAPHVLYMRHGEPFLDAVTVARNNMLPREAKFGTFKVTGLGDLKLSVRPFTPSSLFEPDAERYADAKLIAVERQAA